MQHLVPGKMRRASFGSDATEFFAHGHFFSIKNEAHQLTPHLDSWIEGCVCVLSGDGIASSAQPTPPPPPTAHSVVPEDFARLAADAPLDEVRGIDRVAAWRGRCRGLVY